MLKLDRISLLAASSHESPRLFTGKYASGKAVGEKKDELSSGGGKENTNARTFDGNAVESSRLRRRSNSTESCRFDARSVAFYPGALVVDRFVR